MKQYLISLQGGGDSYYIIVGQAAWDWILSPRPDFGRKTSVMEQVPAAVRAESNGKMPARVYVTVGSCENDRALSFLEGYEYHTTHPRTVALEDTWDGCIY